MSIKILCEKIIEKQNPTVAGLDPKLDYIPNYILDEAFNKYGKNLEGAAAAILEFNKGLIDELCDIVPAVKPQSAYYEMYGFHGEKALYETIQYAKRKGLYVILDGKRNDIGTTAEAYANAYLGYTDVCGENFSAFGADSLTVNGYLGTDGIAPFIDKCDKFEKSIFVLAKTSNPSSGELQDKRIGDKEIYSQMADMIENWGSHNVNEYGYSNAGAVVGATYKEQLAQLRAKNKTVFFLVPGYGAQGGGADDVVPAFDEKGLGAIINSSRAIMCAYKKGGYDEKDYAKAAKDEAIRMKNEILSKIGRIG